MNTDTFFLYLPYFLALVTGLWNAMVRFRTKEQWILFAADHPVLAGIMRFISAVGVNPADVIKAVQIVKSKKPPTEQVVMPPLENPFYQIAPKEPDDHNLR